MVFSEAFNFSVLMDCSNKENFGKVINEAISHQYVKMKHFNHITDKSVPLLSTNSLKVLVIMSLFLLLFLLLFILIEFISFALIL